MDEVHLRGPKKAARYARGGAGMTLPLFQFRNQQGEVVNLSAATDRAEIVTAELYHSIDVGEGLWCRPCQSTGCAHATQIEQILATAGLGRTRTGGYDELPGIARFTRYVATGEMVIECWFDNGACVRFHEQRDGTVVQSVFTPDDSREPAEMTEKPDAENAPACLVDTLVTYCQYRQRGDLAGLRQRYPELARVVGAAAAASIADD